MAEKNKGRLRELLGKDNEGPNNPEPAGGGTPGTHPPAGDVEAYEADWYRSLKALAERQQQIESEQAVAEAGAEGEVAGSETAQPAEAAAEVSTGVAAAAEASAVGDDASPTEAAAGPTHTSEEPGENLIIDLGVSQGGAGTSSDAPSSVEAAMPTSPPAASVPEIQSEAPVSESAAPGSPTAAASTPAPADLQTAPSLTSTDVGERRLALVELMKRELSDEAAERVTALLHDPDRDIRRLALEALTGRADRVDDTTVRQALQDPTDEVRAAAVGLAAAQGARVVGDIVPLVAARRWPHTQRAALEVAPGLIASAGGLGEEAFLVLLAAVAELESSPLETERARFAEIARNLGVQRLIESLSSPDSRRLGAVRLLLEEGSVSVMRALASLSADPLEEVRNAASSARQTLAEITRADEARQAAEQQGVSAVEQAAETEMITALARALQDPDQAVRGRARTALTEINRGVISDWVRESLSSSEAEVPALGAGVAELLGLSELAGEILVMGAALPAEARGPFVGALTSFRTGAQGLVSGLPSIDPSRRGEAIRLVWQVCGLEALPYLRPSLSDTSGPVRMAVLEVFGESGDPAAIEVAKSVLQSDSSPAVRATAIQVIGKSGTDQRLASLSQALQDPDPDVRATALEVLPEGLGGDASTLLLKALGDLDERVWAAAVRHLAAVPDGDLSVVWTALRDCQPGQQVQLIAAMEREKPEKLAQLALAHVQSPDYTERVLSIQLAGKAGTDASVQAAIQALQDPAAPVRREATAALAALRAPGAVTALGGCLADPDPDIRVGAVRALGVIDDEGVLGFLVSALKDPEIKVREVASEVLTQWSSPAVAKRLAEVLAVQEMRAAAADLLEKMGPSAVELMIDVLMQRNPQVTPTVGQLLQKIVGLVGFIERLSSMDPLQRLRATEAVGAIGGPDAVDALVRTLSDPDDRVRVRSIQLLGDLADPRALDPLKRSMLGDPVPDVVSAAEAAVARLSGQVPPA